MLKVIKTNYEDGKLSFTVNCDQCGCNTDIDAGLTVIDYSEHYAESNKCKKCNQKFNTFDAEDTDMFKNHVMWMLDEKFVVGIIDSEEEYVIEFYSKRNVNMLINVRSSLADKTGRLREIIFSYCMGSVKTCTKRKMYQKAIEVVEDIYRAMSRVCRVDETYKKAMKDTRNGV